jgi:hypothetical protein
MHTALQDTSLHAVLWRSDVTMCILLLVPVDGHCHAGMQRCIFPRSHLVCVLSVRSPHVIGEGGKGSRVQGSRLCAYHAAAVTAMGLALHP